MKRLRPGTVPALLDWLKWILLCCWVVGMVRPRWNLSQRRRQDSLRLFCLARTRKRMPGSFALFANQGGNNPEVQPFDPLPALSNNCSAGVKACVRIKSVLIREVRPDAAKIIARTTNW